MLSHLLFALWFLLPAAIGNTAPIFAAALPALRDWDKPIDAGRTWRGKPLLGPHKTWRGIVAGMVAGGLVFWLQQIIVAHTGWGRSLAGPVDYAALPTLLFGPTLGLGALTGDALKSLIKRQRGIVSGARWVGPDQLDYIIGGIVASLIFIRLDLLDYLYMFAVWFVAHLLASYVGWLGGLKDSPI